MSSKQFWHTITLTIISFTLVASPLIAQEPIEQPKNREYWSCCWGDRILMLRDQDGFPVWRRGQIPTIVN